MERGICPIAVLYILQLMLFFFNA